MDRFSWGSFDRVGLAGYRKLRLTAWRSDGQFRRAYMLACTPPDGSLGIGIHLDRRDLPAALHPGHIEFVGERVPRAASVLRLARRRARRPCPAPSPGAAPIRGSAPQSAARRARRSSGPRRAQTPRQTGSCAERAPRPSASAGSLTSRRCCERLRRAAGRGPYERGIAAQREAAAGGPHDAHGQVLRDPASSVCAATV